MAMKSCFTLNVVLLASLTSTSVWAAEGITITPAPGEGGVTINADSGVPAIKVMPRQQVKLPGLPTAASYTNVVYRDGLGVHWVMLRRSINRDTSGLQTPLVFPALRISRVFKACLAHKEKEGF
ncbi:MAG: hypothetical protein RSD57_16925 [Comamonas sp.]